MFFRYNSFSVDDKPIDIRVIGLKQNLNHYTMDEIQAKRIAEIIDVYAFDINRHVHCAELTPSYELHKLYTTVVLTDDDELTDAQRGNIRDPIEQAADDSSDVIYVHTRLIDRVIHDHTRLEELIENIEAYRKDLDGDQDTTALCTVEHYLQGRMCRLNYVNTSGMVDSAGFTLGVDPADYETKELFYEAVINASREYYQGNCPI